MATPLQVAARGHTLLAVTVLLLLAWLCWGLRHVPFEGAQLSWRRGEWRLYARGREQPVMAAGGAVALPWVVLFPFRFAGRRGCRYLWVFADSVTRREWRRLRVRIRLADPVRRAGW